MTSPEECALRLECLRLARGFCQEADNPVPTAEKFYAFVSGASRAEHVTGVAPDSPPQQVTNRLMAQQGVILTECSCLWCRDARARL